ncbi:MAG TPA: hypothetical protein PKX87_01325 [Alphaproteobacteria bacterium]|nr:hypothetical protein [Alphaproteobacteria bacterium]
MTQSTDQAPEYDLPVSTPGGRLKAAFEALYARSEPLKPGEGGALYGAWEEALKAARKAIDSAIVDGKPALVTLRTPEGGYEEVRVGTTGFALNSRSLQYSERVGSLVTLKSLDLHRIESVRPSGP